MKGLSEHVLRFSASAPLPTALLLSVLLAALVVAPHAHAVGPVDVNFTPNRYELIVNKPARTLSVLEGTRVVREFPVSWGRGGTGDKQREGDKRTPVGTYRITDFNDASRFELFMRLNYPNVKDAFFGLKSGVINRGDFDRIVAALKDRKAPPQDTALGGAIGIHGLGAYDEQKLRIHKAMNWTEGCIALTNEHVMELRRYVRVGTKVTIRE